MYQAFGIRGKNKLSVERNYANITKAVRWSCEKFRQDRITDWIMLEAYRCWYWLSIREFAFFRNKNS